MALAYTDPTKVTDVRSEDTAPNYGRTVSGYGGKIPTRHMIRYGNRWHRVYVMQYSNSGTAYIVAGGQDLILDTDTEYRFSS